MASVKVKTLSQAIVEVKKIMDKYKFPYQNVFGRYTESEDWEVDVVSSCDDEDLYDKVYTRCGFLNEERCIKDLTVFLNDQFINVKNKNGQD